MDQTSRRKRLNSSILSKTIHLRMPLKQKEKMERNGPGTQKTLWSWFHPFDGIGGARRALEILELKPALHLSFETDPSCIEVVEREWKDVHTLGDVSDFDEMEVKALLAFKPGLKHGLIIGGAPCQPFSGLNT
eukprot:8610003-Karenia_brevis.AAC.1